ncbi:hypothetical protein Tco_1294643 [Tanacetum coccineum]
MKVIPDEEEVAVDAIPLATKPPSIINWKILKEGKISYYQIIRADGSLKRPEEGYERVGRIVRIKRLLDDLRVTAAKAFNESNYLLKIDTNLLTSDILGFKTYDEFKNEWMDEWNKGIPWVPEEPWLKNGIPINDIHHICELLCFKNGKAIWPTCNSNDEGFCNGGELPGTVQVGYMTYFQDYEWYDDLIDGKLKEEALKQKTIYERSWGDATQGKMNEHECSTFTNWRSHIHKTYTNTNIDDDNNPYLDVSRTFNNHEGRNDQEAIQEEREPNDDHGIGNLDNDFDSD